MTISPALKRSQINVSFVFEYSIWSFAYVRYAGNFSRLLFSPKTNDEQTMNFDDGICILAIKHVAISNKQKQKPRLIDLRRNNIIDIISID